VAAGCQRYQPSSLPALLDALPRDSDHLRYLFGGQGPAVFLDESAPCLDSADECRRQWLRPAEVFEQLVGSQCAHQRRKIGGRGRRLNNGIFGKA
jgi:hypothetical protein